MTLKPKKMKFLFKRFLEYESQHGDEETVQSVKAKANDYVKSIINKKQEEEEEEEQEWNI